MAIVLFAAVQVRRDLADMGLWEITLAIIFSQVTYSVIRAAVSVKLARSVVSVELPFHLPNKTYLEDLDVQVRERLRRESCGWKVGLKLGDHLIWWGVWTVASWVLVMMVMMPNMSPLTVDALSSVSPYLETVLTILSILAIIVSFYSMRTAASTARTTILADHLREIRASLCDFSQFEEALISYARFQNMGYEKILGKMSSKLPNLMAELKKKYFEITKPIAGETDLDKRKLKIQRAISENTDFGVIVGEAKAEIDNALEKSNA